MPAPSPTLLPPTAIHAHILPKQPPRSHLHPDGATAREERTYATGNRPFHRLIVRIQRRVAPVLTRKGPRGLLPRSVGEAAIVKGARAKLHQQKRGGVRTLKPVVERTKHAMRERRQVGMSISHHGSNGPFPGTWRIKGSERSPEGTRKDRSGGVQRIVRLVDDAQRLDCVVHGVRSLANGRKAVPQKTNGFSD